MSAPIQRIGALEEPTGRFKTSYKKLDARMKRELGTVIDELLEGTVGPGRRYEKLKVGENHYSVRLSGKYRFVFQILDNGNAKPVAVGPHDEAYRIA